MTAVRAADATAVAAAISVATPPSAAAEAPTVAALTFKIISNPSLHRFS
jgi:hypothetical protein